MSRVIPAQKKVWIRLQIWSLGLQISWRQSLELTPCGFSNFSGLQVPWADAFVAAGVCGMLLCGACCSVEPAA